MAKTSTVPNVKYQRKDQKRAAALYEIISDCCEGEIRIKERKSKYLPIPNESDEADTSTKRYDSYITRAVFYNVTKRTLDGLCGQIFMRDPMIQVPDQLNAVVADCDGAGVSLVQQTKAAAHHVVGKGRAGLFVDYPTMEKGATQAQINTGEVRPIFTLYAPEKIINWRTTTRNSLKLLSLVVLEEDQPADDDGFEMKELKQWRVLRLVNNVYTVQIYKYESGSYNAGAVIIPTGPDGKPIDEIPFTFIGALNNDETIDQPPMYDIAALNIAHYRNSADYEESTFMVGQPTPVFTGLTEDWVNNILKGKVKLGARAAVSLPVGADAKLLQVASNTMPYEAMQHKERQMVALGARIVEAKTVVRTATESGFDQATESSVLASAANNISSAYSWGLEWAAFYMGLGDNAPTAGEKSVTYKLNTEYDIATMSSDDRRQLLAEWQGGGLSWGEYRAAMRKSGLATLDDKDARKIIDEELASIPGLQDTLPGAGDGNA